MQNCTGMRKVYLLKYLAAIEIESTRLKIVENFEIYRERTCLETKYLLKYSLAWKIEELITWEISYKMGGHLLVSQGTYSANN